MSETTAEMMTRLRIKPHRRTVHMGAKIAEDGSVSALCYRVPHPIDMKIATWTLTARFVTCGKCRSALNAR